MAVYDFKGDGAAAGYGNNVTALVTASLTTETNLVMLERVELSKALTEQAFGVSGLVNSVAAAQIGQITGAKILVAGQVMKTGDNHLVIIANIVGTETGRLFASKVEGSADNLTELTASLGRKIAQTIGDQATNLVPVAQESRAERLDRIIKNLAGTNRPSISINITAHNRQGKSWKDPNVANELGRILMKAGFSVVDENSDGKPDLIITGDSSKRVVKQRGGLSSGTATLEVKVTERRTGNIIAFEHQEGASTGVADNLSGHAAVGNVTGDLAERLLPLLVK